MTDLKATLYYNSGILRCTNFNANATDFPAISALLHSGPSRVEVEWHGSSPLTSSDTLSLGTMIFETLQTGQADINWEPGSPLTYFLNEAGDTIQPVLIPGTIQVHEIPEINLQQPNPMCEGGSITLIANINGGTHPVEYNWQTPDGISHSQSPEWNIEQAGINDNGLYRFTVSDYFHCSDTSQITLTVVPLPQANFPGTNDTIYFDERMLLTANEDYAHYFWNTGYTTTSILVSDEGLYSVKMETAEGCQATESVMMLYAYVPLDIPNAFSPNGDGLNDVFRPVTYPEKLRFFTMYIYDRWGMLVLSTNNLNKGWDGTVKGVAAPLGVYTYLIRYGNPSGAVREKRGVVTLVR